MVKAISFSESEIIYADSDGKPMADNTKQFRPIVTIKENLECLSKIWVKTPSFYDGFS